MTFNKWEPHRPVEPAPRSLSPVARAWALRGATYVSLAMLILGYVLLALRWN